MRDLILGINYSGVHDSSVSVVAPDGEILLAVAEERLSRHKKDGRWPQHALALVDLERVERVCVPYLANGATVDVPRRPELADLALPRQLPPPDGDAFWRFPDEWQEKLASLGIPIHHVDHHDAHAASAYYLGGHDDVLVITCDSGARNCPWWGGAFHGVDGRLTPLVRMPIRDFHPIADAYSDMTAILGFRPMAHEGKITGLAAHGTVSDACLADMTAALLELRAQELPLYHWVGAGRDDLPPSMQVNARLAGRFRERLGQWSREDLAATIQHWFETKVLALVDLARQQCDAKHVALAGGAFANVRLNQKVFERGFASAFVCPPMTDDGLSVGAPLHYLGEHRGLRPRAVAHVYLGPELAADEAAVSLRAHGIQAEPSPDIAAGIAEQLAAGKTVARWHGRMEFGPRALGNRTVYYRADDASCQEWLNDRLQRTEFMPFAPVTLDEDAAALYRNVDGARHGAQFMTLCFTCTEKMQELSPAVVHVDATARPQLVTEQSNPDAWAILRAYRARTGVPTLINTSFNIHEEPIVCSADDALAAFVESGLDYLALGDYLLSLEDCAAVGPQTAARQLARRETALAQKDAFATVLAGWLEEAYADRAATERALQADVAEARKHAEDLAAQLDELRSYIAQQERSVIWRSVKKLHDLKTRRGESEAQA